jgi:hypothetical protein
VKRIVEVMFSMGLIAEPSKDKIHNLFFSKM